MRAEQATRSTGECGIEHVRSKYVKSATDEAKLEASMLPGTFRIGLSPIRT